MHSFFGEFLQTDTAKPPQLFVERENRLQIVPFRDWNGCNDIGANVSKI
jgi:hypothetical protein